MNNCLESVDMNFETLGPHVTNSYVFKGSEKMPFLAPRGVFVANNHLFVSDTGRNRVFIWNSIPTSEYQEPDVVLGQLEIEDTGRNSGGEVTASTLQYPSGIWSDGKILVVADAWNHRVLIWHSIPTENGQPADVVLGQPDFESNKTNAIGIGKDPTEVSPLNITASAPSITALATSVISARVGLGLSIILSIMCVATMTGVARFTHSATISF